MEDDRLLQGFITPLRTEHLQEPVDGKWQITINTLTYLSIHGKVYRVPIGTYTDIATVPPFPMLRILVPKSGRHSRACVLHDYLCESKTVSRKEADQVFLEAMKADKVSWFRRKIMYAGVRSYSIVTFKS